MQQQPSTLERSNRRWTIALGIGYGMLVLVVLLGALAATFVDEPAVEVLETTAEASSTTIAITTTRPPETTIAPPTTVAVTTTQALTTSTKPPTTVAQPIITTITEPELTYEQVDDIVGPLTVRLLLDQNGMQHVQEGVSDAEIETLAGSICEMARASNTAEEFTLAALLAVAISTTPFTQEESLSLMGALVGSYCWEEGERLGFF